MAEGICSECGAFGRIRRELCNTHYQHWLKVKNVDRPRPECKYEGCFAPSYCKGWCKCHYDRNWRGEKLGEPFVPVTFTERLWSKFARSPEGCWLWTAGLDSNGYGDFYIGADRHIAAHVAMYELIVGPVPDGLVLDHLCRVHDCLNPSHVEPVTQAENIRRGLMVALKTHCKSGRHPWISENIYVRSDGRRQCKLCVRETQTKARATC